MKLIISDIPQIADGCTHIEDTHEIIRPEGRITPCIGCFGCWTKTPGKCVIHDGYENTGIRLGRADQLIIASECFYGGFSPFVKAVLDRAISYAHPDFVMRRGEMHHKRRYDNVLRLTALFYGPDITDAEKETARQLVSAVSDNYDGTVEDVRFYTTPEEAIGGLI